jgi:hypothetical protein
MGAPKRYTCSAPSTSTLAPRPRADLVYLGSPPSPTAPTESLQPDGPPLTVNTLPTLPEADLTPFDPFFSTATSARQQALKRRRDDPLAASYHGALKECAASSDPLAKAVKFRLRLGEKDYLRLLCKQLRYAEQLWHIADQLRLDLDYLNAERRFQLMVEREFSIWEAIPDQVTVYRGCFWDNTEGIAWSLDPLVAASFVAGKAAQRDKSPLLARGTVSAVDCIVKAAWSRVSVFSSQVQIEAVEQLEG